MTTSRTHPPEEETAIRYFRKKYNKDNNSSLTANQYADMIAANTFGSLVASMNAERETAELTAAFKAASPAVKASVKTALGIIEP